MGHSTHHHHHHSEDEWAARAAQLELEAEVLLPYVTEATSLIAETSRQDGFEIRRIFDVGSGPGVGTCELARRFPSAHVVAVDASPVLLERAAARAEAAGLSVRITTCHADLQDGFAEIGQADLIWAAMVMHHIGDEVAGLRALGSALNPGGLLVLAEHGDPSRYFPDDSDIARTGLPQRLAAAGTAWLSDLRAGLPDATPSDDYPTMLRAAGFELLIDRVIHVRHDAPLEPEPRRIALRQQQHAHEAYGEPLTEEDRAILSMLIEENNPTGIMHRPDIFLDASRHVYIARSANWP